MATIKNITITPADESVSVTTDTVDITAGKDILFEFNFECDPGEQAPGSIVYNLYANIIGRTEAIVSAENRADLTGNRLTLSCPEQYAGGRVCISFALGDENPALPLPGIAIKTVKYLNVKSAETGAPFIKNVYWAESESVEYGTESAQRSDIKGNEDAFLHIHTRGLFGKRVKVELFGGDALGPWVTSASETLLQSRVYTVQDNVLAIVFPMSAISSRLGFCQLKAAVSCPEAEGKFTSNTLTLDKFNSTAQPTRAESNLGTGKFVIGDLPKKEIKPPETPPEPINADLNVVVGTFSFLPGTGTEQSKRIKSGATDTESTYYTYQLETYELKLQHLIDAGIITRHEVTEMVAQTDTEGNVSRVEQLSTTKIYKVSYEGTDIYGFKSTFNNTVRDRLSLDGRRANGLDYARLKLLRAAILKSGEQAIDTRPFCRSAWQLNSKGKPMNRFKQDPFRYSSNQECPPGAFYVVPCYNKSFLLYVGDEPEATGEEQKKVNIKYWTCTTLTDDKTKREELRKPDKATDPSKYVSSTREGIAFHRGRSVSSVGCITLDIGWKDNTAKQTEREVFNVIFSGNNGEYKPKTTYTTVKPTQKHKDSILKLHLIMIEERSAALRSDISANNYNPKNRYKGE